MKKRIKNSIWGILLVFITLVGCQNEPEYIEIPSQKPQGISFEYFDTQNQLKEFVNQIQKNTSKDLLAKAEQTVAFKVYENKEVLIHREPNKTSYTVAIDKQDSNRSGFSNLVVEFEEDQVKTAFILNYAPTQEYLRNYLENPLTLFKGTVSLEPIQGATESKGLYARGVECQIIKMHLCNNLGEEHAAGVKCDPDHRYIKTHRICTNVPVILGQGQGIGNDSEFSPEGGGATGGGGSTTVGTGGVPTNPVTPDPCDTSDSLTLGLQSTSGECVKIVEAPEFLNLVLELNSDVQQYLNHFSNSSVREEFKKYLRENNYSDEAKRIFKNSATLAKNLTVLESYWPETDEEWAVIVDLFKSIAGETLLGLIPGYDFVDAVKQITKGNYGAAVIALGAGILSFSPAITAKIVKTSVELVAALNKVFRFIKPLVKAFARGFRTFYKNGVLSLKNRFGRIIARGDDVGRVTANIADAVNDAQRNILSQWRDRISRATNRQKGNFGEMATDLDLADNGYIPLHRRIDNIDAPGHQGIDAVFEKNGQYFIVESKFSSTNTPSLNPANPTTGLPKQMSDDWIRRPGELSNVLGNNEILAQQILNSNYTRVVATHGPNGNKIYKLVDSLGNIGNTWTP